MGRREFKNPHPSNYSRLMTRADIEHCKNHMPSRENRMRENRMNDSDIIDDAIFYVVDNDVLTEDF